MLQILVIFYPVDYYRCKKIRYFLDYPVISSQDLSKTAHVKRMEERFTQKSTFLSRLSSAGYQTGPREKRIEGLASKKRKRKKKRNSDLNKIIGVEQVSDRLDRSVSSVASRSLSDSNQPGTSQAPYT